jgi:hypothetical protein
MNDKPLEAIKRRIPHYQGVWEIDFFYFPQAGREKEGIILFER